MVMSVKCDILFTARNLLLTPAKSATTLFIAWIKEVNTINLGNKKDYFRYIINSCDIYVHEEMKIITSKHNRLLRKLSLLGCQRRYYQKLCINKFRHVSKDLRIYKKSHVIKNKLKVQKFYITLSLTTRFVLSQYVPIMIPMTHMTHVRRKYICCIQGSDHLIGW